MQNNNKHKSNIFRRNPSVIPHRIQRGAGGVKFSVPCPTAPVQITMGLKTDRMFG